MKYVLSKNGLGDEEDFGGEDGNEGFVIRLRGLPFDAGNSDIQKFFEGLTITHNGIIMPMDSNGRRSGEAFVHFTKGEDADKALERNKQNIGHRYIEVFKSSMDEATRISMQISRQGGGGGGSGGDAPPMRGGGGYGAGFGGGPMRGG